VKSEILAIMDKIREKLVGSSKQHSASRQTHTDIIQENALKNLGLRGRKHTI